VPQQKPDLFEFATAIVAEPGTGTSKIVRRQMFDARLPGTSLDRIFGQFPFQNRSCRASPFA
jgi:hypothetical protein